MDEVHAILEAIPTSSILWDISPLSATMKSSLVSLSSTNISKSFKRYSYLPFIGITPFVKRITPVGGRINKNERFCFAPINNESPYYLYSFKNKIRGKFRFSLSITGKEGFKPELKSHKSKIKQVEHHKKTPSVYPGVSPEGVEPIRPLDEVSSEEKIT